METLNWESAIRSAVRLAVSVAACRYVWESGYAWQIGRMPPEGVKHWRITPTGQIISVRRRELRGAA